MISRPDQKEEDRHQPVVDPQQQGLVEGERAHAHADRHVQETVVEEGPRRVADQQRHQRRKHKQQPGSRLMIHEGQRALQPVRQLLAASFACPQESRSCIERLTLAGGQNGIKVPERRREGGFSGKAPR